MVAKVVKKYNIQHIVVAKMPVFAKFCCKIGDKDAKIGAKKSRCPHLEDNGSFQAYGNVSFS